MDDFFDPTQDDWPQRLKETPYDPIEEVRQENETFLTELESLAVEAIASGIWEPLYDHIASFPNAPAVDDGIANPIAMILEITRSKSEVSAVELDTPSADRS